MVLVRGVRGGEMRQAETCIESTERLVGRYLVVWLGRRVLGIRGLSERL